MNAHAKAMQDIRDAECRERERFGCTIDELQSHPVDWDDTAAIQRLAIHCLTESQGHALQGDATLSRQYANRALWLMQLVEHRLPKKKARK